MATSLKKKYTQNDLRRLMAEQKAKSVPKTTTTTINSPLAKYPFSNLFTLIEYLNLFTCIIFSLTKISIHFLCL